MIYVWMLRFPLKYWVSISFLLDFVKAFIGSLLFFMKSFDGRMKIRYSWYFFNWCMEELERFRLVSDGFRRTLLEPYVFHII